MSFLKHLIPPKAKVRVNLDRPSLPEGEPVTGSVNVDSTEYIQSTGVRIEARTYEHYEDQEWVVENNQRVPRMVRKTDTLFSRDVPISGPSDFGQGPTRTFPFSVGFPPARPTHMGGSVEYSIKGVVAVKGRPDATGATQVAFSPPMAVMVPSIQSGYAQSSTSYAPSPQQPRPQIRCQYCQTMIDQGTAFCPNCGAHL